MGLKDTFKQAHIYYQLPSYWQKRKEILYYLYYVMTMVEAANITHQEVFAVNTFTVAPLTNTPLV